VNDLDHNAACLTMGMINLQSDKSKSGHGIGTVNGTKNNRVEPGKIRNYHRPKVGASVECKRVKYKGSSLRQKKWQKRTSVVMKTCFFKVEGIAFYERSKKKQAF
jgi:hypothetical protein